MTKPARDSNRPDKTLIGWKEWLALPELNIPAVKAKIDTGARTSALHTFQLDEFTDQGRRMIRFGVHPLQKRQDVELFCVAPILERRRIKDSGGHVETRYLIETNTRIGQLLIPIKITLTNRDGMLFRMLLGRKAVENQFIVDPARAYLHGRTNGRLIYNAPSLKKIRRSQVKGLK